MALLIFDLDGTLIDSRLDLAHAVNATRRYMGMPDLEHEQVYRYVGNGALVLIQRALGPGASEADIEKAHTFFLQYYREHALDYTTLYPGVIQALDDLRTARHQLAILTNKPVGISRKILDGLAISGYFFEVFGGNSFEFKKPHPIGIETLVASTGTSREDTWMIGDSSVDIQTARNAGVRSCGLTYGFQPETLRDVPPDVLVDGLDEFVRYLA